MAVVQKAVGKALHKIRSLVSQSGEVVLGTVLAPALRKLGEPSGKPLVRREVLRQEAQVRGYRSGYLLAVL